MKLETKYVFIGVAQTVLTMALLFAAGYFASKQDVAQTVYFCMLIILINMRKI